MAEAKKKRKRIHYTDHWLTGAMVVLTIFSTIMIASANISNLSSVVSDVTSSVIKQLIFLTISYTGYFVAIRMFSFDLVKKFLMPILLIELGALLATRMFGGIGGAYAWIRLPGGMSIQPSEFGKMLIVLTVANFMCDRKSKKITSWTTLARFPLLEMIFYAAIIVVWQSDFGSGFVLIAIGTICYMIPDHPLLKKSQIVLFGIVIFVMVMTVFLMSPTFEKFLLSEAVQSWMESDGFLPKVFSRISYQFYRFLSAGDPLWDRFGYSQELLNSLLGISRGNIRGVGLGNSIQKFGYLASADADYIFPVIVEELGLIGIAFVFIPYGIILATLIRYALKVKTEKEKVVLVGAASYLFVHMFLNIGGVSALIPLTGVPLVMVSRGGTALISYMFMLGICQNIIARYRIKEEEDADNQW